MFTVFIVGNSCPCQQFNIKHSSSLLTFFFNADLSTVGPISAHMIVLYALRAGSTLSDSLLEFPLQIDPQVLFPLFASSNSNSSSFNSAIPEMPIRYGSSSVSAFLARPLARLIVGSSRLSHLRELKFVPSSSYLTNS